MKRSLAALIVALTFATAAQASTDGWVRHHPQRHVKHHGWLDRIPVKFIADAMCVHDGWHHRAKRPMFPRTWNVPDSIKGGRGEATWHDGGSPYYNGFQFAPSTWRRAKGSPSTLVSASPAEQIYRVWVIVMQRDHGSWSEWPWTARACGLPT